MAGETESSRAGGSVLSSILQSKLLVPPPGSFPKGQGSGARGRGVDKEEIDKQSSMQLYAQDVITKVGSALDQMLH